MGRLKYNLEKKRFGNLLVLGRDLGDSLGKSAWRCECDCGKIKIIVQQSLMSGGSRSCGCGVGRATARRQEKKIRIGSRFGKLKVLNKEGQDRWGSWLYKCRCDCGELPIMVGSHLRRRNTRSCGCAQRESVTTHGKSRTLEYRRIYAIRSTSNRRALQKNAIGTFSEEEVNQLLRNQNNKCHYCRVDLSTYHRDHKVPLIVGGTNTIDNIALSCPPCNLKKNRKTDKEFFRFLESPVGEEWLSEKALVLKNSVVGHPR